MKKDFIDIKDLSKEEFISLLDLADNLKNNPLKFAYELKNKTLLMIFEKPSLRTRLSFEVGMTQLGGHAIYYDLSNSPMGKKESVADTAKTASRYADIIMARLFSHQNIIELAKNAEVPVINALTDFSHPCQILSDIQTIREKKGNLSSLKLVYYGDSNNNVTHSLIEGCSLMGIKMTISCPNDKKYLPSQEVLDFARKIGGNIEINHDALEAAKGADVIYTDSWMSYHIDESMKEQRKSELLPFQVTMDIIKNAKPDVIFMHCLPAMRGMEQTAEVIDSKYSIVFDQAENRLHAQKALMLNLLGGL